MTMTSKRQAIRTKEYATQVTQEIRNVLSKNTDRWMSVNELCEEIERGSGRVNTGLMYLMTQNELEVKKRYIKSPTQRYYVNEYKLKLKPPPA